MDINSGLYGFILTSSSIITGMVVAYYLYRHMIHKDKSQDKAIMISSLAGSLITVLIILIGVGLPIWAAVPVLIVAMASGYIFAKREAYIWRMIQDKMQKRK